MIHRSPAPAPPAGAGRRCVQTKAIPPPAGRNIKRSVSAMRLNNLSPLWAVVPLAILDVLLLAGWFLL